MELGAGMGDVPWQWPIWLFSVTAFCKENYTYTSRGLELLPTKCVCFLNWWLAPATCNTNKGGTVQTKYRNKF